MDTLAFEPSELDVSLGDTVTFVVRNDGNTAHEFVLGDEAYQEQHADEMHGDDMATSEGAVEVAPGETKRLTWRFTQEGEVLYGCHEPGHYEGGMVGNIRVSP